MQRFLLALSIFAVAANAAPQFIPDKQVVIHRAVESKPERKGELKGPGSGLGSTPPSPPESRPGGTGRGAGRPPRADGPPAIPPPPPAPEISAAGAAVEQTTHGMRAAIQPLDSFDALGEGFVGQEFAGGRGNGGRGSIDLSLAVGPDHIFEILGGSMAVFTK